MPLNLPISTESELKPRWSMKGPLLVLSVCTAGLRRRRLRGLLPQLSRGRHRRRSRPCCLQTPGRAGCHQVDKVSHFARRQDYSQGQRLKWLLFELQSPKHSHTARQRERHMRAPAPPPCRYPFGFIVCTEITAWRRRDIRAGLRLSDKTAAVTVPAASRLTSVHKALVWRNAAQTVPWYSERRGQDLPAFIVIPLAAIVAPRVKVKRGRKSEVSFQSAWDVDLALKRSLHIRCLSSKNTNKVWVSFVLIFFKPGFPWLGDLLDSIRESGFAQGVCPSKMAVILRCSSLPLSPQSLPSVATIALGIIWRFVYKAVLSWTVHVTIFHRCFHQKINK